MCCPLCSYPVRLRPCCQLTGSISTIRIPSLTMQWPLLRLDPEYGHVAHLLSLHPHYIRVDPRDQLTGQLTQVDCVSAPCLPANRYHSAHRLHLAPRNQRYAHCKHHTWLRCGGCPHVLC